MVKRIHALSKWQSNQYAGIEIDTTSNSGEYRELSPFVLGKIPTYVHNLEASRKRANPLRGIETLVLPLPANDYRVHVGKALIL